MKATKIWAFAVCFTAMSVWGRGTQMPATVRDADEREIKRAILARGEAYAAGDCERFESYLAPDVIEIEGSLLSSHEVLLKDCRSRHVIPGYQQESVRSDFSFKFMGNVAVVTYLGKKIEHFGNLTPTEIYRGVDVLEKRDGKWRLKVFTFVPRFEDPPAYQGDAATLNEFVGKYAWIGAPNMIDTVTRSGDRLYLQSTGDDSRTPLIWEAGDTFALHDAPERITFLRDKNRQVIEEFGRGIHAQKIE